MRKHAQDNVNRYVLKLRDDDEAVPYESRKIKESVAIGDLAMWSGRTFSSVGAELVNEVLLLYSKAPCQRAAI